MNAEQPSKREDAEADRIVTSGKDATDREASEMSAGQAPARASARGPVQESAGRAAVAAGGDILIFPQRNDRRGSPPS